MSITPDQLRQFAEACGYFTVPSVILGEDVYVHDDQQEGWELEQFLHSKDAVIEALEWFCKKHDYYTFIRCDHHAHSVGLNAGEEYPTSVAYESGETLNIAIILAVNSAAKSEVKHED